MVYSLLYSLYNLFVASEVCPWTTDPSDSTHFGLPDVNGDILDPQECQPGETFNDQDGFCRCMNQRKSVSQSVSQ